MSNLICVGRRLGGAGSGGGGSPKYRSLILRGLPSQDQTKHTSVALSAVLSTRNSSFGPWSIIFCSRPTVSGDLYVPVLQPRDFPRFSKVSPQVPVTVASVLVRCYHQRNLLQLSPSDQTIKHPLNLHCPLPNYVLLR